MKAFFAKNLIAVIVVVVVLAGAGAFWYVHSSAAPAFATTTVSKGNVVESVDEQANVMTEHNAALSFQEGGEIAAVNVSEGSVVQQGQVLATLNAAQLSAAAEEADAAVAAAQAKLDSLASGTRPEQIQIDESAIASANNSLGIAVQNAYTASNDAIENQTDNLFSNPKTDNPVFLVPITNSQTMNQLASERVKIGADLAAWYQALSSPSISSSQSGAATLSGTADTVLQEIGSYLDTITLAVNSASAASAVPASTLASYKAYVATATGEVQGSTSAVTGAESGLTNAQNTLALAQAGTAPQDIEAQQAAVAQAQAAAASAHVALDETSLVAPFSGTVQDLTAQVGQVTAPGTPVLTLVNQSGLKIEAYASEADVAKIQVGDPASVTLDAYGTGTVFPASVTTIDPGETDVNGVPEYLLTLHFTQPDSRIKDGMTASVHIVIGEHDNVLEVPTNLVISGNGSSTFVLVSRDGSEVQQPVTVGLTGDNGMTEITSGLSAGDTIVNF
jgi:HlyD family secretion protein